MKKLKLIILSVLFAGYLQAQTNYNVNDRVEVLYQGKWYKATVLKTDGAKAFVHWDGYSASYDSWAKPDEIRKMGAVAEPNKVNTASTSNATETNANAKFKVGDKVTYMDDHWCDGTITGMKNGYYLVDFPDQWLNAQGKQGVPESAIQPQWKYKAFFEELKALQEGTAKAAKATTIIHLAAMVCADCSPNGNDNRDRTTAFVNDAKKELVELKALVKKYEPLPDNGNKYFHMNPAVVGKVASESDKVIAELVANALKPRIQGWFTGGLFYDLTFENDNTEHLLLGGKHFEDFVYCGTIAEVKTALIKNLEACIVKYGLKDKPEDYLKGYEENWATRKAKLEEEAADNSWVKSEYPIVDNSLNSLLANPDNTGKTKLVKVVFNQAGYSVNKDDYGNITEQSRGGMAFYQISGCSYWMYYPITAFKTYAGGGKYKPTEVRFFDEKYIKPF